MRFGDLGSCDFHKSVQAGAAAPFHFQAARRVTANVPLCHCKVCVLRWGLRRRWRRGCKSCAGRSQCLRTSTLRRARTQVRLPAEPLHAEWRRSLLPGGTGADSKPWAATGVAFVLPELTCLISRRMAVSDSLDTWDRLCMPSGRLVLWTPALPKPGQLPGLAGLGAGVALAW